MSEHFKLDAEAIQLLQDIYIRLLVAVVVSVLAVQVKQHYNKYVMQLKRKLICQPQFGQITQVLTLLGVIPLTKVQA